jgi:NAD(P)-dependent dehydrogenase (short-subunit alcohol dehydrogenase family)
MTSLSGKVAWVTGAGSGIGEAAALKLAGAGAAIVLTGRRKEPLEAVARKIEAAEARAQIEPGDVTDAKRPTRSASTPSRPRSAARSAGSTSSSTTPAPICASVIGPSSRRIGSTRSSPAIFRARSMSPRRRCR